MSFRLAVCAAAVFCLTGEASAQIAEDPYAALPREWREAQDQNAALLNELVLGWCFKNVRGVQIARYSFDPYGKDWVDVLDYEATNELQLFRPRSNSTGSAIVDLSADHSSCFVQLESESTPYTMRALNAELSSMAERLVQIATDKDEGRASRQYLMRGDKHHPDVIIQLHAYFSPSPEVVVAIVQRVSVSEKEVR